MSTSHQLQCKGRLPFVRASRSLFVDEKVRCCTFFLVGFEEDLGSELVFWFDADHSHEQSSLSVLLRSF